MSEERLQKFLARAGVASRRHAEEMIEEGRVTVNGKPAGLGDKVDPERDAVKLDGKRILHRRVGVYLALNKPRAVMSAVVDPGGRPTVLDLVPPALRKALVPVGRLDFLTEGLILLTDDGEFAQSVAHPRYGCRKTYEVKVQGTPRERDIERLREGIPIEGRRTAPAEIEARRVPIPRGGKRRTERGDEEESENSWWTVVLREGRTRQIREMFLRIGHAVMKLRRVAVGSVSLQGLALGHLRALTEREVASLRRAADAALAASEAGKVAGRKRPPGPRRTPADRPAAGARPRAASAGGARSAGTRRPAGGRGGAPASRPRSTGRGADRPEFEDAPFAPSGSPPARRPPGRSAAGSRPGGRARAGAPAGRKGVGRPPGSRTSSSPSSPSSSTPRKPARRGPGTGPPRGKSPSSPRSTSSSPRPPGRRGPGPGASSSRPPGRPRPAGGGTGRPSGGGRPAGRPGSRSGGRPGGRPGGRSGPPRSSR